MRDEFHYIRHCVQPLSNADVWMPRGPVVCWLDAVRQGCDKQVCCTRVVVRVSPFSVERGRFLQMVPHRTKTSPDGPIYMEDHVSQTGNRVDIPAVVKSDAAAHMGPCHSEYMATETVSRSKRRYAYYDVLHREANCMQIRLSGLRFCQTSTGSGPTRGTRRARALQGGPLIRRPGEVPCMEVVSLPSVTCFTCD
jgi:hypothetical protein